MTKLRFLYLIFLFLISSMPLYGYIDPGTGSLLVSAILGFAMTLVYALRGFFYSVLSKITGKKVTLDNDFQNQLIFFNEGKNYWNVFFPVIKELIENKQEFVYLTADCDDPGLKLVSPYIEPYCLGNINDAILFLNHLKADTVVMTTPQLGILHLKRSKNVRHYCHLLHSPCDIHTYKKFAFDYFDSVLCSSMFQIENLRQLEKDRNKKRKELYKTGCTYYDLAIDNKSSKGDAILLAPTWGDKSFFKQIGEELIEKILNLDYTLIYRPHPQSWISDASLLETIVERFGYHPNFIVDKSTDNKETLNRASVLICDLSGIVFDFTLLYNKPVIAVDKIWKNGGYEDSDISNKDSTNWLLNDTGMFVNTEDLLDFATIMNNISCENITKTIIDKHIFNFKNAGKVAAMQIISIFKDGVQH